MPVVVSNIVTNAPDINIFMYVDYINNEVKDEVLEAANTIFGNLPIEIVVAGGRNGTPIILGVLN